MALCMVLFTEGACRVYARLCVCCVPWASPGAGVTSFARGAGRGESTQEPGAAFSLLGAVAVEMVRRSRSAELPWPEPGGGDIYNTPVSPPTQPQSPGSRVWYGSLIGVAVLRYQITNAGF